MADRISETLQQKLSARLAFYEDIGIELFYRDRTAISRSTAPVAALPPDAQQSAADDNVFVHFAPEAALLFDRATGVRVGRAHQRQAA